jgi:hypothetical protein
VAGLTGSAQSLRKNHPTWRATSRKLRGGRGPGGIFSEALSSTRAIIEGRKKGHKEKKEEGREG